MKLAVVLLCAAFPALAHMVSVSTGEARLDGQRLHYELRMPLFEAQHLEKPEALLDSIRFEGARRMQGTCREVPQDGSFRCTAVYEFPQPVDRLEVECVFHTVTVPNHTHVLRAVRGDKSDQAVFELSATKATLRFEPPGTTEIALTNAGSGFVRAVTGAAPVLFLFALSLAARTRRERWALLATFFTGQVATAVIVPRLAWNPSPRFIEAAAALTVAYLAVEILLLPKAGQRWLVVGVLGLVHGLAFAAYLKTSGQAPGWFLAGALTGELAVAFVFAFALAVLLRLHVPQWAMRAPAAILLAIGLGWFGWLLL